MREERLILTNVCTWHELGRDTGKQSQEGQDERREQGDERRRDGELHLDEACKGQEVVFIVW